MVKNQNENQSFRQLKIPILLTTSKNDITDEFFRPILSLAKKYDRGVGYFSSGWLRINSVGLTQFAENFGRARWITSPILDEKDWHALLAGENAKNDCLTKILLRRSIPDLRNSLQNETLSALAWLIADNIITFKIAIPKNLLASGEFHDKFGIFEDAKGNQLSFSGSYNDSIQGTRNYESIKVFKSWQEEYSQIVDSERERFELLWQNCDANIEVFDLPSAAKKEIIKFRTNERPYSYSKISHDGISVFQIEKPKTPNSIVLREYQQDAIKSWKKNNYNGIFEMATGTGKTITSLAASIELFNDISRLCMIILCPFIHLVNQWKSEAENFSYSPVTAMESKSKWLDNLNNKVIAYNHEDIDNFVVITTYSTFKTSDFQQTVARIKGSILIIGDEVHHLGTEMMAQYLPKNANFRLGLSATPKRLYDFIGTQRIENYFGDIVFEYSLPLAIKNGHLTPYYYYPYLVRLTQEETTLYQSLTKKIGKRINIIKNPENDDNLLFLLLRRAQILQNAENKHDILCNVLNNLTCYSNSIFYSSPQKINELIRLLGRKMHIRTHKFTYQESKAKRRELLKDFENGVIHALVAIKCLDEGVDVPSTQNAFILSSSSDPREFIQRRGRILRKHPGKKKANIYDFIAVPPKESIIENDIARGILRKELIRFNEFADNSLNFNDAHSIIWEIQQHYEIFDM